MKEKFRNASTSGEINIKMDDTKGYWEADKKEVLRAIIEVCKDYHSQGYSLTLRQLYYQLVSKDLIPNHDKVYKKLSSLKDDAVYSGLVDWKIFEDRGRLPHVPYSEHGVSEALLRTVEFYTLPRQRGQEIHIEVWTEKDAISSILKNVTNEMGITLVVNKGYTSSTAIYGSYKRFCKKINEGKKVVVLYFGDHDPSGLDMIRDINDRILYMLSRGSTFNKDIAHDWWEENNYELSDLEVEGMGGKVVDRLGKMCNVDGKEEQFYALYKEALHRLYLKENDCFKVAQIGLTMEQINEFNPPPNPAKITDPRAKGYIREFGQVSWEVDALKPPVMEEIVQTAIHNVIDMDVYNAVLEEEAKDKQTITNIVNNLEDK